MIYHKMAWAGLILVFLAPGACNDSDVPEKSESSYLLDLTEQVDVAIQENDFRKADSLAFRVIEEAGDAGEYEPLIDVQIELASSYLERNRIREARELITETLDLIEDHGSALQEMRALIQLSNFHFMSNNESEGLETINEVISFIPKVDHPQAAATAYASRARAIARHNPAEALELYLKALNIFIEEEDFRNEAVVRNNIGQIYHDRKDHELAMKEFEQAMQINRELGNDIHLAMNYNNVANTLSELNRKQAAADSLMKAIEINQSMGISPSLIRNYYNLGRIYLDYGEYEEAYTIFEQAYEESRSINFMPGVMHHATGLAEVLLHTERYSDVQAYIDESRELAENMENLDILAKGWDLQMQLREETGDFQGALLALREQQAYSDSLDHIRRDREFEEVRTAYEVDLKSAENELLRQELSYQERLSRNQRLLLFIMILGVLSIAAFLVVLYRNQRKLGRAYRSLKQKNHLISLKNAQLKKLNEDLKQLNADKDRLIDIIVHDLRNPLFGVIGFLDVMADSVSGKEEIQHLEMARNSAYRLNELIDSLLDVHSLEKHSDDVELKKVRVDDILTDCLENFSEPARKKGIVVDSNLVSLEVESYPSYLLRIVENLVSNAIKFSPKNSRIRVHAGQKDRDSWQLTVSDEGPGFSDADRKKMFSMFGRLSAKPTGGEASTGLGLYTVNMLVHRLRGRISLESTEGKGSTFIVELPNRKNETDAVNETSREMTVDVDR